jgi:glycosyltransferase involved in cell wall biosynthesis
MRILVVHQYYLAAGEPGGSRFNELARSWKASGHDVSIIAGTLNYATGESSGRPGGWITRRDEAGITVWRCHVPRTYSRGYFGRMWAFLCFTLAATWAARAAGRADVVVATSPPLTAAIPGLIAARLRFRAIPWVFEIRDLWPESAITTGVIRRSGLLARLLFTLERVACRTADAVVVLTPAFAADLKLRGLVDADRIVLVTNGVDVEAFVPASRDNDVRREFGWGNRFVALYAGAHGRANALDQLLQAAEHLRTRADVLIASVGDGPERERLEADAKTRNLTNLQFLGAVPKERMPAVIAAADAGLAVLQNNPTFKTVYPNKLFDYMACERPTILAIDGAARLLACDQAKAAVFVPPEDGRAIAEAIVLLADSSEYARLLGRNGRAWVLANAARSMLARRYLDTLELLGGNSIRPAAQETSRAAL